MFCGKLSDMTDVSLEMIEDDRYFVANDRMVYVSWEMMGYDGCCVGNYNPFFWIYHKK